MRTALHLDLDAATRSHTALQESGLVCGPCIVCHAIWQGYHTSAWAGADPSHSDRPWAVQLSNGVHSKSAAHDIEGDIVYTVDHLQDSLPGTCTAISNFTSWRVHEYGYVKGGGWIDALGESVTIADKIKAELWVGGPGKPYRSS